MVVVQRGMRFFTLLVLVLAGCGAEPDGTTQKVVIGGRKFVLELALTDPQRIQGLSDRHDIAENGGMLFVFPDLVPGAESYGFVMRHCYVPIDLLYLDPDGRVIATHEMQVEPYDRPENQLKVYAAGWPYQFAIELRSGMIRQCHLGKGDKVELTGTTWPDLKDRAR